jgi:sporulation protein YlmC with PRC-barrel domain
MAFSARDLVGLEAVSRNGEKIGKIRNVISDPGLISEYLVITYSLFYDLIIPTGTVERRGATVTVLFARLSLYVALRIATEGTLSSEDRRRLESFYRSRVA